MWPIIFIILSVSAPGLLALSFLYPRFISGLRAFALIYGVGSAVITFELLLYFVIARQTFSPWLLWFFGAQTLLALVIFAIRFPWKNQLSIDPAKVKPLSWLLSLLIAGLLFLSLIQALGKPPVTFDSIAFWATRAEILLADGAVNFDRTSPNYLASYNHPNYPWHVSLLEYWFRLLGASGGAVNLLAWFYFLSLILFVADFSIKYLGQVKGLLLTLFFCSQPFIFYHASNNYADLIVAYYAAVGFGFFFEWLERSRLNRLLLAAAFIAWTFNVKNYGSFYIIALAVGWAAAYLFKLHRPRLRSSLYALGALVLPILPIALFKIFNRLNLRNTEPAWVWRPDVLPQFTQSLLVSNNWNIWWFIVITIALVFCVRIWRRKELLTAWLMLLTLVSILIVIFIVTENYQWALDHTALSRAFIPLVPISTLLIAISLEKHSYGTIFSRR